jgi:polysaccharide export outer membrane protein
MKTRILQTLIVALLFFTATAHAQDTNLIKPVEEDLYLINPGDVLDVRVFGQPQFSRDGIRVSEDGKIRMPFIEGDITAACLTERGLRDKVTELLKEFIREPQVDVVVREYQSTPIAVLGAVRTPSRFQLSRRRNISLVELMAQVGGPSDRAGQTIQLTRATREGCVKPEETDGDSFTTGSTFYKLEETMRGDAKANPLVRPGDLVIIPEAEQVFVVGNVVSPRAVPMREPITLSKAIAAAGGALPDSKRDKVRLVRQDPSAPLEKREIIVDLGAIEKLRAEDIALQPNDIIEVPLSGGKRLFKTFIGSFVPSVAQLPTRVIY